MSLLVVYILFTVCQSVIIWNDPLNSTNGHFINWTTTLDTTASYISDPYIIDTTVDCPDYNYCWQFHAASSAYYISSTLNFINISITYRTSSSNLEEVLSDECVIYYSNNTINGITTWYKLQSHTNDRSTHTIPLPSSTYNNVAVGIKIAAVTDTKGADKEDDCYFQDISLNGDTMPPTTANPTTTQPTTSPTTASPTDAPTHYPTITPTTAEPSHHPTTAQPSTAQPTLPPGAPTSAPTLFPVTATPTEHPITLLPTPTTSTTLSIATTNDNNNNDADSANEGFLGALMPDGGMITYGIYGGASLVVLLFIVIVICCCCKKRKAKRIQSTPVKKTSNVDMQRVAIPATSPPQSPARGQTANTGRFMEESEEDQEHDKYDEGRIRTNTKRTNALPDDFWGEESESREKHRVVNEWQTGGSNVMESKRNVQNVQKQHNAPPPPANHNVPPPPSRDNAPAPPTTVSQIFGRRKGNNEEEDSDDDSLMKKQHEYQGNYDPNAPVDEEDEYEDENEELKADHEECTPRGDTMALGESDDDDDDNNMLVTGGNPPAYQSPGADEYYGSGYTETEDSSNTEQNENEARDTRKTKPFMIQVHNEDGLLVGHEAEDEAETDSDDQPYGLI